MNLINKLSERLARHPKRIVFPEGADPRILQAARQFAKRKLGVPILLGDRQKIKDNAAQLDIKLDHIRIIEPERSEEVELFVKKFQGLRRFAGLNDREVRDYVINNNYFAALMLATGQASAIVSGATVTASSALRPLIQIVPRDGNIETVSSLQMVELDDKRFGTDGVMFMADCAVVPEPTAEQLSDIAITTAALSYHLTNVTPRVAMLSYTSKSTNSKRPAVAKMKAATELAHEKARRLEIPMEIDGELQVDAALDLNIARLKGIESSVAGRANVLIFPDLAAGNIAMKMVQILGGASLTYGPILTGLSKPAAEISRGASAHDIFGSAVIVGSQAIDHKLLHPTGDDED